MIAGVATDSRYRNRGYASSVVSELCSIAFSYTGEYLATADMNGVIKVWKSSNGQLLKTLQGPEDLEWIRWHSKSNILLASGNDYTIWSWSLPKGFALPVGRGRR